MIVKYYKNIKNINFKVLKIQLIFKYTYILFINISIMNIENDNFCLNNKITIFTS
jgi:hypothetical protein